MPAAACRFLYDCEGCGTVLRPKNRGLPRILFLRDCPVSPYSENAAEGLESRFSVGSRLVTAHSRATAQVASNTPAAAT